MLKRMYPLRQRWLPLVCMPLFSIGFGCVGGGLPAGGGESDSAQDSASQRRYPLDTLPRLNIRVNDHTLRTWVVQDFDTDRPGSVQEGLMHVPEREIADDEGMLFVFADERIRGFWMLNTITPLDIAYARANGEIVQIWQMPPMTLQTFSSIEPAMFALEVKQGTFERLGVEVGDRLEIPDAALRDLD